MKIKSTSSFVLGLLVFALVVNHLIQRAYRYGEPSGGAQSSGRAIPGDGHPVPGATSSWSNAPRAPSPAMYAAAKDGDREQIQMLLDQGADLEGENGARALMGAIVGNQVDTVTFLLDKGADVNAAINVQRDITPLGLAIFYDRFEIFKILLSRGADPNATIYQEGTVMGYAVGRGKPEYVQLLLAQGVREKDSASAASSKPANPRATAQLLEAALAGRPVPLQMLLDNGADIHTTTRDGVTPLMNAAYGKGLDAVRMLLERGADINAGTSTWGHGVNYQRARGWTPLMFAVQQEEYWIGQKYGRRNNGADVVAYLLDHGANPNASAADGKTPLWIAIEWERADLVALLVAHGANVNAVDTSGQSLLALAVTKPTAASMAAYLIDHGAKDFSSALSYAARYEQLDAADLLLQKGADINATDRKGKTALMACIYINKPAAVKFLLDHGADRNIKTPDGRTARDFLHTWSDPRIVSLMQS